jgi:hypothetical protein
MSEQVTLQKVEAKPITSMKLFRETRDKLRALKKEPGFANYNALLNYMALEVTREGAVSPASFARVFKDSRPVVLTGQSEQGRRRR